MSRVKARLHLSILFVGIGNRLQRLECRRPEADENPRLTVAGEEESQRRANRAERQNMKQTDARRFLG